MNTNYILTDKQNNHREFTTIQEKERKSAIFIVIFTNENVKKKWLHILEGF